MERALMRLKLKRLPTYHHDRETNPPGARGDGNRGSSLLACDLLDRPLHCASVGTLQ
jgi:hypothetical protein